jgi:hypothetical protein
MQKALEGFQAISSYSSALAPEGKAEQALSGLTSFYFREK